MKLNALTAISPVDGRYRSKVEELAPFFSEFGLIQYRVRVEIEYFIALCGSGVPELADVPSSTFDDLRALYTEFSEEDAQEIKETEKTTNHDVKAVEYFIKKRFPALGLESYVEFVHFGLTSQDVNNTAIPLSLKEGYRRAYLPALEELIERLNELSQEWAHIPMLARTHGQPASPTRLGKEIAVFVERLKLQMAEIERIPFAAKFGGATGNFNAHQVTYPNQDWKSFGTQFVEEVLGLKHSWPTTQIEHYDYFAAFCDGMKRVHNIIMDLDRDIWTYISMDYFKQKIKAGEVGSSAMPHKVNPIDFENSEGNLGIANALLEHLAAKLPISRLQRDLTDSTVLRNAGMPLAHGILAIKSTLKGLGKLLLNEERIASELEANWAVVAEAIQNILRREGYPKPYEALKALTRTNEHITQESLAVFIGQLEVREEVKQEMIKITPHNYTGI
ncbi:adenylosuccinate lyase [Cryomorphaceae bacterium]|nr:adenylosuccinate lyase [Cryomorphaceae bacterium]